MAVASDDSTEVEKLYQYGENLNESQDKSQVTSQLHSRSIHCCFIGY